MARSVQSLAVGKVIGDVVDMFTPTVEFGVYYGGSSMKITNGCKLKPSVVADKPIVLINSHSHHHLNLHHHHPPISTNLYTLVS